MKALKFFLLLTVLTLSACNQFKPKGEAGTFSLGNKEFLLNGEPFLIRAGEIHFPRIPREYWEHRIQMVKAMGMNTICIYVFWNFHEQEEGQYDFTGQKDIAEFARLVQENDMYLIVRPGPYVCAEWDMGGLPWWLLKKKDLKVRTSKDKYFMERADKFITEVGKQLAPYQIQNGGNIIMVQVENEYGAFGNEGQYMEQMRDITRKAFDKVQLFRCDWGSNFNTYEVDDVATTLNFGAGSDVDKQFEAFEKILPKAPRMCSEYWTGWFDHWGRPHETRSTESFIGSLKDMLDRNVSFSLFMAHGGTTFGQWGGANSPPYSSMVTSYDYNAPINEAGQTTDKFYAVRNLLKNYLNEGEVLAEIPAEIPMQTISEFTLTKSASVFDNLPQPKISPDIQSMEMFNQGWGSIIYRTKLPAGQKGRKLVITQVHDWARIFIDGKPIGKLDRRHSQNSLLLPATNKEMQLDIFVEAMGRVNFGQAVLDRKGITEKVELVDGENTIILQNWQVYNLPVDAEFQRKAQFTSEKNEGPAWYKGTFKTDKLGDTYLDFSNWGKGMVWINGKNIGRFWRIGPQQSLFVPGSWLRKGKNEVIILDLENDTSKSKTIKGIKTPILDKINPEQSLLHRKEGQTLNLFGESSVFNGKLKDTNIWQEFIFNSSVSGRYFCFEAVSPQQAEDKFAAIAEMRLIGADGNQIPTSNWKVIYADSEEVLAANNNAEKVYDLQESTFWHSEWRTEQPDYPHHIVIDIGKSYKIKGIQLLSRTDKSNNGNIKEYKLYLTDKPYNLGE
ncbi:MAG: beta-galactosidase [Carboxylicivirga sp.]|nr:beta-galactosidase [Carboxylicivirga sp.]